MNGLSHKLTRTRYIVAKGSGSHPESRRSQPLSAVLAERAAATRVRRTLMGAYVLEMTEQERREFSDRVPDAIVEPDQRLTPFGMPGLPGCAPDVLPFSRSVTV